MKNRPVLPSTERLSHKSAQARRPIQYFLNTNIVPHLLKQNVNSFFIKNGTFSCQIKGKTAKILMITFFVVTTTKLLSHFFLCFHKVRTVNFIHQHPVDFLLHRLSCVLTVMESDNISCLPNPFCKCIALCFHIYRFIH